MTDIKCYVVRAVSNEKLIVDKNYLEKCTSQKKESFAGIQSLTSLPDGTWSLAWNYLPTNFSHTYQVFARKSGAEYNFAEPLTTLKSGVKAFTSEYLAFQGKTCFVVRANSPKQEFTDANTKELCTSNEQFSYAGIADLTSNNDGTWKASWEALPGKNILYKVFARAENGSYDFTKPLVVNDYDKTSYTTENLTLIGSRCYLVRAFSSSNSESEANSKELCTGNTPLASFPGCLSSKVLDAQGIKLDYAWPLQASEMVITRDGLQVFSTTTKSITSFTDAKLNNTKEYTYKCKAKINNLLLEGTTTVKVQPLNSGNFPSFLGCSAATAQSTSKLMYYVCPPKPRALI
jgi:hypothetical protein